MNRHVSSSDDLVRELQNAITFKEYIHGLFAVLISLIKGAYTALGHAFVGVLKVFDTIGFKDNVMPPVIFLLCVFGILMAIFHPGLSSQKNSSKNVTAPKKKNFFNPLSFIPIPTYKMKLFSYNFAPYGNTPNTTISDRPTIKGRCDNLRNYELSSKGVCLNTTTPEPIVWTLDVDKMPELNELSQFTKDTLYLGKYTVTIPWAAYKSDGLHYYPDCRSATFGNGESASHLFTDNGTRSCEKKSVERTVSDARTRLKFTISNGRALDSYL